MLRDDSVGTPPCAGCEKKLAETQVRPVRGEAGRWACALRQGSRIAQPYWVLPIYSSDLPATECLFSFVSFFLDKQKERDSSQWDEKNKIINNGFPPAGMTRTKLERLKTKFILHLQPLHAMESIVPLNGSLGVAYDHVAPFHPRSFPFHPGSESYGVYRRIF